MEITVNINLYNVVRLAPSSLQYSLYPNGKVPFRQIFKVMQLNFDNSNALN